MRDDLEVVEAYDRGKRDAEVETLARVRDELLRAGHYAAADLVLRLRERGWPAPRVTPEKGAEPSCPRCEEQAGEGTGFVVPEPQRPVARIEPEETSGRPRRGVSASPGAGPLARFACFSKWLRDTFEVSTQRSLALGAVRVDGTRDRYRCLANVNGELAIVEIRITALDDPSADGVSDG